MPDAHILLILADASLAQSLERDILGPAGYRVTWVDTLHAGESLAGELEADLVILGERFVDGEFSHLAAKLHADHPALPLILYSQDATAAPMLEAARYGLVDSLRPPLEGPPVLAAVSRGLEQRARLLAWARAEARQTTRSLRQRVDELETLARVGQTVTASLDLESVLAAAVEAAVEVTGAEEGSLLLLDEASGELYMRASRNFQDEFARTFRLPVEDTLAGQVIQTGEPVLIDDGAPQKIKTAYLVHTLLYVPLKIHGRTIGVLGVDRRHSGPAFRADHIPLLSAIANYASIAMENARLYAYTEVERKKLETILGQIEDGVIVIDPQGDLILVNRTAREAFFLDKAGWRGQPALEALPQDDLRRILGGAADLPYRIEIELDDGRFFNTQFTPIPEVGLALTMQDVTHFKELDRIKSDFVNTVSHDLRSPLTAILGYVELFERSGPVNDRQREFIRRVQISVKNITELIDDLLDLGRIEAGLDLQREPVPIPVLIQYSVEGYQHRMQEARQRLQVELSPDLPRVLGNPIRLRQMLDNLLGNAIKYTPAGGEITVRAEAHEGQMILQVQDTGIGIPLGEQPYIFDKLYRASNISPDDAGTGLGLSIVRSIVENHNGRIWVDSAPGKGSTFTVVLPLAPADQGL